MVHSLKADSVVMVTSDFKDQTVVMETTNGSLLYGKPGKVVNYIGTVTINWLTLCHCRDTKSKSVAVGVPVVNKPAR